MCAPGSGDVHDIVAPDFETAEQRVGVGTFAVALASGVVDPGNLLNPGAEDGVVVVADWQSAHPGKATVFEPMGVWMPSAQPSGGLDEIVMEQFLEAHMGSGLQTKRKSTLQSRTRQRSGTSHVACIPAPRSQSSRRAVR